VQLQPFAPLAATVSRSLAKEAAGVEAFLSGPQAG
jgi:hypothetical protein